MDRLATLYFFHPVLRLISLPRKVRIPILMYHSISEVDENHAHAYFKTATSPHTFAKHLKFLHVNKYSVITLNDLMRYIESAESPPGKCVVITFDDGYRDFYTHAFHIF